VLGWKNVSEDREGDLIAKAAPGPIVKFSLKDSTKPGPVVSAPVCSGMGCSPLPRIIVNGAPYITKVISRGKEFLSADQGAAEGLSPKGAPT